MKSETWLASEWLFKIETLLAYLTNSFLALTLLKSLSVEPGYSLLNWQSVLDPA